MSLDKINYRVREKELSEARYELNLQGLSGPKKRLSCLCRWLCCQEGKENNVQAEETSTGMPRCCCWS